MFGSGWQASRLVDLRYAVPPKDDVIDLNNSDLDDRSIDLCFGFHGKDRRLIKYTSSYASRIWKRIEGTWAITGISLPIEL
jgi:hypothetical protein